MWNGGAVSRSDLRHVDTATLATWRHLDLGVSIVCISAELHTENSLSCAQIHRDILGYIAGVQCSLEMEAGCLVGNTCLK